MNGNDLLPSWSQGDAKSAVLEPFNPDARQTKILTEATLVGEAMAKANDFYKRQLSLAHYVDGSHRHFALCMDLSQESPCPRRPGWARCRTGAPRRPRTLRRRRRLQRLPHPAVED
jgi:hypothetical protein